MRASDLLVRCLEAEGVDRVFGIPGEENLDVMDSLKDSSIELILTRHETSAALIASTIARLTNEPQVCLSTLGPGATNMVTGVAEAFLSYIPLIAITGQVGTDQAFFPRKQHLDLGDLYRPITKESLLVRSPGNVPALVRRAFQLAAEERPGPVHLELPEDVMKADAKGRPIPRPSSHPKGVDDISLARARDMISASEAPLILAGPGVHRSGAVSELRALAHAWGIPVANTWHGVGTMPFDDDLSLNTVGLRGRDRVQKAFETADLVLLAGHDVPEYLPQFWNVGRHKRLIGVVSSPMEDVPGLDIDIQLLGPLPEVLRGLSRDAVAKPDWASAIRKDLVDHLDILPLDQSPVKPQLAVKAIRSCLGRSDICVSDVGAHMLWLARRYPVYEPNTLLLSNGLIPMGIGVPAAIGAKLASPESRVVAVVGDGGLMMSVAELETAKRLGTSFVTVVFNDNGLGLIKLKHQRVYGRHHGTDMGNPDLVKLAESFGARAYRAFDAKELEATLREALDADELALIEVPIDYMENTVLF